MSNKKSIISKCVFTGDWKAPNGSTIYYHELTMQNGDVGSVGKKTQNPPEIAAGVEVEYSIDGKKMKIETQNQERVQNNGQQFKKKSSYAAKPTDFLGYSYAYAKDLVVAGKTSETDMKDLKRIAEEIYNHIAELIPKHDKIE